VVWWVLLSGIASPLFFGCCFQRRLKMTKREFVKKFKEIREDYHFRVLGNGFIRGMVNKKLYCPITAVCEDITGIRYPPSKVDRAQAKLGLNDKTAEDIIDAADGDAKSSAAEMYRLLMGIFEICS
jgi:hypothetical protein